MRQGREVVLGTAEGREGTRGVKCGKHIPGSDATNGGMGLRWAEGTGAAVTSAGETATVWGVNNL